MMSEDAVNPNQSQKSAVTEFPYRELPHILSSYYRQGWRLPTVSEARMMGELAALGVGGFQESKIAAGMLYYYYWTSGMEEAWGAKNYHVAKALATYPGRGYEIQNVSQMDFCRVRLIRTL